MDDYSAQFIYKPPVDSNSIQSEFGTSFPVRFITETKNSTCERCIDCESKSHAFALEDLNLDDPDLDLVQAMKKIKEALLWVLWNTDYPVGE